MVVGRGGGAFANHDAIRCNAEIYLNSKATGGFNVLFLRVKRGMTIEAGAEIYSNYGTGLSLQVALGNARFERPAPATTDYLLLTTYD